jgi:uncharacterized protein (TIGR00304 family)
MKKKRNMIELLIPVGILLIFLGIIIIFAGTLLQQQSDKSTTSEQGKPKVHIGIGGFIGPIPFGFANSKTALYITIGAAAFFFIVWLILKYARI